jgi:phage FluMu protein Com
MPRLMIKCPKAKKLVPTGMFMSKDSFDNPANVLTNNTVRCFACGEMHTWSKSDAVLEATR